MLNVFFTVDVEIWCDGWQDIDRKFPAAYSRYIVGTTPAGQYGMPYQLQTLNDHGLKGVFFVEPLFSARFGQQPLQDVTGMVRDAGHEVQLHLHTEWVDEARTPLLPGAQAKRQHLRYFSLAEQASLIKAGAGMIEMTGCKRPNTFRAGSFGFNRDTMDALAANGIAFDSSYNATTFGLDSGLLPGQVASEPFECAGVWEYPMTVFKEGTGRQRHAQLTACSYAELEGLLWQALEAGRSSFVILSHSFELLNARMDRRDDIVVKRFDKLCAFLNRNRDSFRTCGFDGLVPPRAAVQPPLLASPLWRTGGRIAEQLVRRFA
ncbi:polysaccharide deacetylase family protein [Massilia cavernae]|uniref:Polysaccharide deacetylase n=1 Tax=Massilia cavernae TaxID=2320864 RepID=A0A418XUA0_9BURK|nr:polysaccharide deacetylase [Massilia cavernae]RJG16282.1 polysaccharide deacetylase [Massilia cavernae]